MNTEVLQGTLLYIMTAPYFWLTVGAMISVFMFIGAIIFDGDLSLASKGIMVLFSYVFFLIYAQVSRIANTIINPKILHSPSYMWYASNVTIGFLFIASVIGIIIGVWVSMLVRTNYKHLKIICNHFKRLFQNQ